MYAEESIERAKQLLEKLQQGIPWKNEELIYKKKDGQKIHGLLSVNPVFDDNNNVLLQKRAQSKMLWPLYWEATCSSHPRENETYEESGTRRLKEELRINADLKLIDKFYYQSFYKDIGAEHEICATLVGSYNEKQIDFNKDEVADLKWIKINELKKELSQNSNNYAPWLKIALDRIEQKYGKDIKSIL